MIVLVGSEMRFGDCNIKDILSVEQMPVTICDRNLPNKILLSSLKLLSKDCRSSKVLVMSLSFFFFGRKQHDSCKQKEAPYQKYFTLAPYLHIVLTRGWRGIWVIKSLLSVLFNGWSRRVQPFFIRVSILWS